MADLICHAFTTKGTRCTMIHKREELCTRHFNMRNRSTTVFDDKQMLYRRKSERMQLREREAQSMGLWEEDQRIWEEDQRVWEENQRIYNEQQAERQRVWAEQLAERQVYAEQYRVREEERKERQREYNGEIIRFLIESRERNRAQLAQQTEEVKTGPAEHIYEKEQDCPVCMESMDNVTEPLSCGHWSHIECLRSWKPLRLTCSVCKTCLE